MKESAFYREIIEKYYIDDKRIKAKVYDSVPGYTSSLRKALSIAVASIIAFAFVIMMIPSARAEVLSWLGVSRLEDYLSENDPDHTMNADVEKMISSPVPNTEGTILLPIDREKTKSVDSESALAVSHFLYENSDISLGRALFDGSFIYQAVQMKGLSGLFLLEAYAGGNTTSIPVNPYKMQGIYGNTLEDAFYTGEKTLYQRPTGWIIYEMTDGTRFGGEVFLASSINPYLDILFSKGLMHNDLSEAEIRAIERSNITYLNNNNLTAVAKIHTDEWVSYVDADGNITAKVFYYISVTEEDCGYDQYVPDTELFYAYLGTVSVNMYAYEKIEKYDLIESEPYVLWEDDEADVCEIKWNYGGSIESYDNQISLAKYRVPLMNLIIQADLSEATIDVLGIHGVQFHISLPEEWTIAEREAFAFSLRFNTILINGEKGEWHPGSFTCNIDQDGSVLWRVDTIDDVPHELMQSIQTITFIPALQVVDSMDVYDENERWLGRLEPDIGCTTTSALGAFNTKDNVTYIEYPDAAFTLRITSMD